MDRDWLAAVHERQNEVRDEIARHRLGVALRVRRRDDDGMVIRCRRVLGRVVVALGRVIEGDERESERALPCN
ncbi:MAG: hypothetical protein JO347_07665 [Candidatus Eremiobacteraeota bacterium]|nr:hypothetical protein [Candidatus Eremiobacteraeota bacterium]MBV8281924.1 hypothetical protein [Candidatus Eremiobacteraeota bacterium]